MTDDTSETRFILFWLLEVASHLGVEEPTYAKEEGSRVVLPFDCPPRGELSIVPFSASFLGDLASVSLAGKERRKKPVPKL